MLFGLTKVINLEGRKTMNVKKIVICLILVILLLILNGCVLDKNYLVRFDINSDEVNLLYKNMKKKDTFALLGLPHRSTVNINSATYDYFVQNDLLRLEFKNNKLNEATLLGESNGKTVRLSEKKDEGYNVNQYLKEIHKNICNEDIEFITKNTNAEEIQDELGPPHDVVEYTLKSGLVLNAFSYSLDNKNILYIIYKSSGIVGIAQIENTSGELVKELVELHE